MSYAATTASLWKVFLRRLLLPLLADTEGAAGPPATLKDSSAGQGPYRKYTQGKLFSTKSGSGKTTGG